jgi:hypothetical protein
MSIKTGGNFAGARFVWSSCFFLYHIFGGWGGYVIDLCQAESNLNRGEERMVQ